MILFFLILILSIVFSIVLWIVSNKIYDNGHEGLAMFSSVFNIILDMVIITAVIMCLVCIPIYFSAKTNVKILNAKYHTEYTAEDYFFAGDTINKILKTDENLLDSNNKINLDIKQSEDKK